MNSFKSARFTCVLILLTACSLGVAEDPVNIPDPALKAAVMEALGQTTDPTPADMLNLTAMMNASNRGITDLTGLEYAQNLAQVNLGGNQVEDISILAGLTRLREVGLSWNRLTDISALGGLTELTYLEVTANQITDIGPLAGLTKLRVLYVNENQIGSLTPLVGLTNLQTLGIGGTSTTDLSPLAALIQLTDLNANGNSIRDVGPLAGLTALTTLGLRNNQIADVGPLSNLTNLIHLDLHADSVPNVNQVADISPLAGMINMKNLTLAGNPIRDISVLANMTQLEILDLDRTGVADLTALTGLTNLLHLSLEGNQIADVGPLAGLTGLTYLRLGSNQVQDISPLGGLTALERLELQDNQIEDCQPVAGLTKLTYLHLGSNRTSSLLCLSGLINLEFLFLYGNQIVDVAPLASLTGLLCLNCDWNQIVDISPLSTLTRLTSLALNSNRVSDIAALAALSSVQGLDLDNNLVEDISPLAGLTALTSLNLGRNAVTDISALTGLTRLMELRLSGNPLHPKACFVDIPRIKANNPGIAIHYDGCINLPQRLTVSSTPGGAVVMPGEGIFEYAWGELVPVEAVAEEGYQFTHWSGTAVDPNIMLDPSAIHTSVFMDSDHSLTAHFKPQDQPWKTVYFNDFQDGVGLEWSCDLLDVTPVGARRFLGQFGNDIVTLVLTDLPFHTHARLSFDLFAIRSWDGNGDVWGLGPDHWALTVGGQTTLLDTTFDNHPYEIYNDLFGSGREATDWQTQAFPGNFPEQQHQTQTGAAEINSLGYLHRDYGVPQDAVYHVNSAYEHAEHTMTLGFSASGLQELTDESWGLDNVRVEVLTVAEPEVTLTVSSTLGGAVTAPGEGIFAYANCAEVDVVAEAEHGYYFVGWTGSAVDSRLVADPSAASTTVTVCDNVSLVAEFAPACMVVFDFPLDSDPGWARSGQWEFGIPTGQRCGAWGNNDPAGGHTGSNVFGVNLDGCYDPGAGPLYSLVAGPFDLSAHGDVKLSFWRWLNADWCEYVRSSVEVSTDGMTWDTLWQHSVYGGITDLDWTRCTYRVPQADCQPTVYVRWSYQVIRPLAYSYTGWNIDDIQLSGCLGCAR